jgi:hypothetical protein
MTKIAIVPNAAGTGTFTIEAPNSNSNRTLVLPDSAGTVATAESTLAQFNATGSAPVYACRAWVNFDGSQTPPSIRASGNVSSVTRTTTGVFVVNLTIAVADVNYSLLATCTAQAGVTLSTTVSTAAEGVSSFELISTGAGSLFNADRVYAAIFR